MSVAVRRTSEGRESERRWMKERGNRGDGGKRLIAMEMSDGRLKIRENRGFCTKGIRTATGKRGAGVRPAVSTWQRTCGGGEEILGGLFRTR
jgi:hypothetical protein